MQTKIRHGISTSSVLRLPLIADSPLHFQTLVGLPYLLKEAKEAFPGHK